jgi:hypothetical protein
MRNNLVAVISIVILASCSSSNKTYRDFNNSQYSKAENRSSGGAQNVDKYPLRLSTPVFAASRDNSVLPLVNIKDVRTKAAVEPNNVKDDDLTPAEAARRTRELSKLQRKEFRKAMRESMRRYVMPSTKKDTKRDHVGG